MRKKLIKKPLNNFFFNIIFCKQRANVLLALKQYLIIKINKNSLDAVNGHITFFNLIFNFIHVDYDWVQLIDLKSLHNYLEVFIFLNSAQTFFLNENIL